MITQRRSNSGSLNLVFFLVLALVALSATTYAKSSNMMSILSCSEKERQALLDFKQSLTDESKVLSSWSTESDRCCEWRGITCDGENGHVVGLDLGEEHIAGNTNISTLLGLQHLRVLNLSKNGFDGPEIPRRFGATHWNLQRLDLSWNDFVVPNLDWLSGLSSLTHLDLSGLNLSQVSNWHVSVSKLPSLLELHLGQCNLPNFNHSTLQIPVDSFSKSLKVLDLSVNIFNTSVFHWVSTISTNNLVDLKLSSSHLKGQIPDVWKNMTSLKILDLSDNKLEGGIPKSFQKLCSLVSLFLEDNSFAERLEDSVENLSCARQTLERLDLSRNPFSGSFPNLTRFSSLQMLMINGANLHGPLSDNLDQLSKLETLSLVGNLLTGSVPAFTGLSSLRSLDLSDNQLNGTIAESIGLLSSLQELNLRNNSLNGVVTETHFSNLSRLRVLNFHENSITLNLSSDWTPPFQLEELYISSCKVGPAFPSWLENQKQLEQLSMSQASITGSLPDWFSNLSSPLKYLNLAFNNIHGEFPDLSSNRYLSGTIDLSYNKLSGPIPPFPPKVNEMILSKNMFSGPASSLCATRISKLRQLDLSDNKLSGELPDCWTKFDNLVILNLANNHFSGKLPPSLGNMPYILFLHLRNNNFSGGIYSLQKANSLGHLDLGSNIISEELPEWIGESLKYLRVLRLRSNKFYGRIPTSLCGLQDLQVLDLSQNSFSGVLPNCLHNLTALATGEVNSSFRDKDSVNVTWKGKETEFERNLELMRSFDVSSNHLSGKIPESITSLLALKSLNLSRNKLTGRIPGNISQLADLESLDLSLNQLFGEIPSSIGFLYFLNHLNLSYNKLTGKIPPGPQMLTFEASCFIGNDGLFGPPLTVDNATDRRPNVRNHSRGNDDDDGYVTAGFYVSLAIGFVVGFWGFCGSLMLRRSWRHSYFLFWNNTADWLFVTARVYKARMLRRFTRGDNN